MKIAEWNDMMAYLTRRQKFSNGGDVILPKPNPLSQQDRNQKVFNDYVGRMKHYLTGAEMPEWFVKDLIIKKADELGIELKADGGRIGFNEGTKPVITKDKFIELRIKHKNTHTNTIATYRVSVYSFKWYKLRTSILR